MSSAVTNGIIMRGKAHGLSAVSRSELLKSVSRRLHKTVTAERDLLVSPVSDSSAPSSISQAASGEDHHVVVALHTLHIATGLRTSMADETRALESLQVLVHREETVQNRCGAEVNVLPRSSSSKDIVGRFIYPLLQSDGNNHDQRDDASESSLSLRDDCQLLATQHHRRMAAEYLSSLTHNTRHHNQSASLLRMLHAEHGISPFTHPAFRVPIKTPLPHHQYSASIVRALAESESLEDTVAILLKSFKALGEGASLCQEQESQLQLDGEGEGERVQPAFDAQFVLRLSQWMLGTADKLPTSSGSDGAMMRLVEATEDGSLAKVDDALASMICRLASTTNPISSAYSPRLGPTPVPYMPPNLGATERLESITKRIFKLEAQKRACNHLTTEDRSLIIVDSALMLAQPKRVLALLERGEVAITFATWQRVLQATFEAGDSRRPTILSFIKRLLDLRTNHNLSRKSSRTSNFSSAINEFFGNEVMDSNTDRQHSPRGNALVGGFTILGLQEELLLRSLREELQLGRTNENSVVKRTAHRTPSQPRMRIDSRTSMQFAPSIGSSSPFASRPGTSLSRSHASAMAERMSILAAAKAVTLIAKDGGHESQTTRSHSRDGNGPGIQGVDDFLHDIGLDPALSSENGHTKVPLGTADALVHSTRVSLVLRDPTLIAMAYQHRLHILSK